jgi:hypothetical protein
MTDHPNYAQQKRDMAAAREQRVRDEAHAEALAEQADRIRADIFEVLSGTGFYLSVNPWESNVIVLEHFREPGALGPDYETPLEG